MRWIFLGFCVFGMVLGCHQPEVAQNETDLSGLKQRFEDEDGTRLLRVTTGLKLVKHKDGQVFLAEKYWAGHRKMVQAVIDSAHQDAPELAAQLLARLMATAGGETKLHFESQLIKLGDSAVDALVTLAESETDWQTLVRTLDALGKIKAKQGVEVMRAFLHHENDWVRIAAAHALGDVGGKDVVPPLVGALADSSDTVLAAALIGLGKVGDRRVVKACGEKLRHKNPRVRAAAVSALGRLGGDEAQTLLKTMLQDADSGVRFKAKKALEDLAGQSG